MPKTEDVTNAVEKWFQEKLVGAPLSHFTPAFNQVSAAKEDLKKRLATLFGDEQPAPTPPAKSTPDIPPIKPGPTGV